LDLECWRARSSLTSWWERVAYFLVSASRRKRTIAEAVDAIAKRARMAMALGSLQPKAVAVGREGNIGLALRKPKSRQFTARVDIQGWWSWTGGPGVGKTTNRKRDSCASLRAKGTGPSAVRANRPLLRAAKAQWDRGRDGFGGQGTIHRLAGG